MYYIIEDYIDPYYNLATEEHLFRNSDKEIIRLWRNNNTIVVGRNQNTLSEINYEYVIQNNINVVRRLTGGGAVYHDLGNLNYTFIEQYRDGMNSDQMFRKFTAPIIEALNSIGVNAKLEGRNDLLIDGKKFSGNAIAIYNGRVLQHGTLLFESSINRIGDALRNRPEKFSDKAVKSNKSRVTNIKEHILKNLGNNKYPQLANLKEEEINVLWFKNFLKEWFKKSFDNFKEYNLLPSDSAEIERLYNDKYSTREWNFGSSPKYTFNNSAKFPGGIVELYLTVTNGIISELNIFGDYFFTSPTEEFIRQIIGTPHTYKALEKKISTIDIGAYFYKIEKEEILNLFF